MTSSTTLERLFFTFRNNGNNADRALAEVSVETLAEHEPPVGADANSRSWFGAVDDLGAMLETLGFSALDVEGVISSLKVNKVATREVEVSTVGLLAAGFTESE